MFLKAHESRLELRLERFEQHFLEFVSAHKLNKFSEKDMQYLEGLTSCVWQCWSRFCRNVVIDSSIGATTASGAILAPCVTPVMWTRVSYVAQMAAAKKTPKASLTNSTLRFEPTWGDVAKLVNIVNALAPNNAATLLGGFGSVARGPRHVQLIRNAAAHRNSQTLTEVHGLMTFYTAKTVRHPLEALFWIDPTSKDFLFMACIDDMRLIAQNVV